MTKPPAEPRALLSAWTLGILAFLPTDYLLDVIPAFPGLKSETWAPDHFGMVRPGPA
jgi:hypothetical protein